MKVSGEYIVEGERIVDPRTARRFAASEDMLSYIRLLSDLGHREATELLEEWELV